MSDGGGAPAPHGPTLRHLATRGGPVLVWNAPFRPRADGVRVLQAFHVLVTWHRPAAYLVMAGPDDHPAHRQRLQTLANELTLDRLWLMPNPSPNRAAALSAGARLVLTPAALAVADAAARRRLGAVELAPALASLLA